MKRYWYMSSVVIFVAALLLPAVAMACDCDGSTAEGSKQISEVVFLGTVTRVESVKMANGTYRRATFQVGEIFKGSVGKAVTLVVLDSICDDKPESLKQGSQYLVFASSTSKLSRLPATESSRLFFGMGTCNEGGWSVKDSSTQEALKLFRKEKTN